MLCRTLSEMRLLCWQHRNSDKPWSQGPPKKKTVLSGRKTAKNLSQFFWRLANTYQKYILQKNWVKTVIPALSSGRSNLQRPIWGCHRQLDDRDHLVGQLTTRTRARHQHDLYPIRREDKCGAESSSAQPARYTTLFKLYSSTIHIIYRREDHLVSLLLPSLVKNILSS